MNREETAALEPQPPPIYKDRSPWLVFFGLVSVLAGIGFLLIALGALFAPMDGEGDVVSERRELLAGSVTHAALGAGLISLGVGSIKARRWARSLNLATAWIWLSMSLMTMLVFTLTLIPAIPQWIQKGGGIGAIELIPLAILAIIALIFCIVLPIGWILFFSRSSARATCEARNPSPSWTDACPFPALFGSVVLLTGVVFSLDALMIGREILPFFGTFLVGRPATAGLILVTIALTWCAWGIYRSNRWLWWLAVVLLAAIAASGILSYSLYDISEIYRLYDYKEITPDGVDFRRPYLVWISILTTVPPLIYICYIGRFCPARH